MLKFPYLKDNRLADVLAALQVMALNAEYTMSSKSWALKISGDDSRSDYWKTIFEEHPEFFRRARRSGNDSYALIWRRALPRYNVDTQKVLTLAEFQALSDQEQRKISRPPVPESQIKTLMDMAINLRARSTIASRGWLLIWRLLPRGTAGIYRRCSVQAVASAAGRYLAHERPS